MENNTAIETVTPIRGQTIDQEGLARGLSDEGAAKQAGFAPKPPLFSLGTMVVEAGVNNARKQRMEFEQTPLLPDACSSLIEKIRQEERADTVVSVPHLFMNDNGSLSTVEGTYPLTARAFEGLCGFVTPGGSGYLSSLGMVGNVEQGIALRAANMNHHFPLAYRVDKPATKRIMKAWKEECERAAKTGEIIPAKPENALRLAPKAVTLRTRLTENGLREVFAVVGPKYGAHNIDEIARQVMACKAIPVDARCFVNYDGYKASIDILFHSNISPEKYVAGEIFRAGIRIRTADDGSGAIIVESLVYRNLCLNLIVIDVASQLAAHRRHVGKNIAEGVEQGILDAYKRVGYFAAKWSEATVENVLDRYGVTDPRSIFEGLVANGLVHVAGVSDEEMVTRLHTAWAAEGGYSKAAIVNAVSRAAHTFSWNGYETTEDLEATAGSLLFQKVWNIEMPKEVTEESLLA